MKKILYMLVTPLIALFFNSCGGGGQNANSDGESESKGTIGVSVLTLGNPFFNVIAIIVVTANPIAMGTFILNNKSRMTNIERTIIRLGSLSHLS